MEKSGCQKKGNVMLTAGDLEKKRVQVFLGIEELVGRLSRVVVPDDEFASYMRRIDRYRHKQEQLNKAFLLLSAHCEGGSIQEFSFSKKEGNQEAVSIAVEMLKGECAGSSV